VTNIENKRTEIEEELDQGDFDFAEEVEAD